MLAINEFIRLKRFSIEHLWCDVESRTVSKLELQLCRDHKSDQVVCLVLWEFIMDGIGSLSAGDDFRICIEDIRHYGWQGLKWRVYDVAGDAFSIYCESIDINGTKFERNQAADCDLS